MQTSIRILVYTIVLQCFSSLDVFCQVPVVSGPDTSYFMPRDPGFNLIISADRGNIENVRLLLSRGISVNSTTYDGVTALMYAADKGYHEIVQLLIDEGAEADRRPDNGITALMSAAINNHFESAEILALHSVNLNLQDASGVTAVNYAAAYNHYEIADMLIFYGADPEIPDNKGNTPLITASYNNCYESVDILIQNEVNINTTDKDGYTALMSAIQEENEDIIELLIESGADIYYTGPSGLSAVVIAVRNENIELAEKLFDLGAEIEPQRGRQADVFEMARSSKNHEMIDLLTAKNVKALKKPDFSRIVAGTAVGFNLTDFFNGFNAGILETKYNTGIFTGFHYRPSAKRIFTLSQAYATYQYWERRYFLYAGVEKRFSLLSSASARQTGVAIGVNEIFTFGGYRGSEQKPASRLITVPRIALYYSGKHILLQLNYEYMNFKTPGNEPGRINLSAFYTFPLKKRVLTTKRISWL